MQLFGTTGQKFLPCPGTKGQRDELKILPRARTGRDSQSKHEMRHGTGKGFDNLSRDRPGRDFDSLDRPVPENPRTNPGQKGRRTKKNGGVCPGIFAAALLLGQRDSRTRNLFLSRDKGTSGRPVPVCPGTSRGTSRPVETLRESNSLYIQLMEV